ncbi:Holliday junction resolvase Hjc [Halorarum salinum]|uniref:Nucleoid-structuring protein H-NS n=1 Tax=Halorarum salinum TaxID=2743089 RepID=A0A7D5LBK2_9EURY|nr:Holliday junction resolvase Hjc [Halobaculum salinum]QLG62812.1 nucleoid-structuring protein H-NS [Halobaculum salinum]
MGKGEHYERELMDRLKAEGFAYTRTPGSGGKTTEARPDIVAGHRHLDVTIATEAKFRSGGSCPYKSEEILGLESWALKFGATPLLAARFSRDTTWYFLPPSQANETPSGNRSIRKADRDDALTLEDIITGDLPPIEECLTRWDVESYAERWRTA